MISGKSITSVTQLLTWSHGDTDKRKFARLKSVAALLSLLLLISAYANLPDLHVFGHDEVHYNTYFKLKLLQDGRWLNYLILGYLRGIDISAWFIIYIASNWLLAYRLSRQASIPVAISFIAASVAAISPPVVEQGMWPATAFPAVLILIVAEILVRRGVLPWVMYLFLGISLFGTMQNYYFLTPLLFIDMFMSEEKSRRHVWGALLRHVIWWVLGAVIGALVMSTMLLIFTGHFGPLVDDWRAPHPVKNVATLIHNIGYSIHSLGHNLIQIYQASELNGALLLAALAILLTLSIRKSKNLAPALLLLTLVAVSFYAFSIPLAPIILMRSLIALMVALILFIGLLARANIATRATGAVILLLAGFGFQFASRSFLQKQAEETSFLYDKIHQLLPAPASSYASVSLFGTMPAGEGSSSAFNNAYQMNSVVEAIGFNSYHDCREPQSSECSLPASAQVKNAVALESGRLSFYLYGDKRAAIVYRDD